MKADRPLYHIRSKWLTIANIDGLLYFELDRRGNLVKGNGQLIPHHIVPMTIQTSPVQQLQERTLRVQTEAIRLQSLVDTNQSDDRIDFSLWEQKDFSSFPDGMDFPSLFDCSSQPGTSVESPCLSCMFFSAGSIARTEYDENDWFCSDFALQK
jgi:hypothetical protein